MDSPPPSSDSQLSLRISPVELSIASASEKAWHLLALLLRHGRPADPSDLASKCSLFDSDPDLVRFLCSIPNSPIRLAQDWVTFSKTGLTAVAQFAGFDVVVTVSDSTPRFVPTLMENVRSGSVSVSRTYSRKRKRQVSGIEVVSSKKRCSIREHYDEKKLDATVSMSSAGIQNLYAGMLAGYLSGRYKANASYSPVLEIDYRKLERAIFSPSMSTSPTLQLQDHNDIVDYRYNPMEDNLLRCLREARWQFDPRSHDLPPYLLKSIPVEKLTESAFHTELSILHRTSNSGVSKDDNVDFVNFVPGINHGTSSSLGADQNVTLQSTNGTTGQVCRSLSGDMNENCDEVSLHESNRWDMEDLPMGGFIADKYHVDKAVKFSPMDKYADKTKPEIDQQGQGGFLKYQVQSSSIKVDTKNWTLHEKKYQALKNCMSADPHAELEQYKRNQETNPVKHRTKQNYEQDINARGKKEATMENGKRTPSASVKNDTENKSLPDFESFLVEKEEGSGGYGTVYRAKRKSDGIIFAIKCPHAKANRIHVLNEMKMLQRLGGKNYVIKYEGSFKSGDSDCLVLEHVKHDRPEVLKREINIFQLQWYGYCIFRALAGLHKLGIVHRDVKPGNFLFSCTVKKGFLIDFNLALDLHKKQGSCDNPGAGYDQKIRHHSLSQTKSTPPAKERKSVKSRISEAIDHNTGRGSKSLFPPGILKKVNQAKVHTESGNKNINKSQGADVSGITSAKDATSTRTPSAERLRQPMPNTTRRELRNWAQEALQGDRSHENVNTPTSKRKRVAAPPHITDRKYICPTPMPLHASGVAIHGAGLLKGNGKHRREGPCVGTKGFRAPEVLFKSVHQGPKIDVWSAGVTLLYLMIGRTPFTGEPEQNIKEIANLRGSEDLWEVAKLHNQESQFPPELFNVKHLSPINLRDWCAQNTRRPEFLKVIPRSLFDLVDKCLTVNPRTRISAEEALRHEFFAPCHEILRKQRLQRQASTSDSGDKLLLHGESQSCEVN